MSFQATPQERAESLRSAHLAEVHADAKEALVSAVQSGDVGRVLRKGTAHWAERSAAWLLSLNLTCSDEADLSLASFIAGCLKSTDPDVRLKAELMVSVAAERFASDELARAEEM